MIEIRVANLYLNPDKAVSGALYRAKKRNVEVKGYFNGTHAGSAPVHQLFMLPTRFNYDLLTEANEYNKKEIMYHKKVMTIDSRFTVVGVIT